ncbi:MAG: cytochrome c [Chitinophagales bacterium]|nr:cytochrome c [Chitinophagales bacterium]
MKKKLCLSFMTTIVLGIMLSCGNSGNGHQPTLLKGNNKGKAVYQQYCKACHGDDGTLGLSGASNLMVSVLEQSEVVNVVTNGRRLMAPFKGIINQQEIDSVAAYVMTLRK